MKSVAAHPFIIERLWDGKSIGDFRVIAVEGGIETGNLQKVRLSFQNRPNWSDIVRLMQWCERIETLEFVQHC